MSSSSDPTVPDRILHGYSALLSPPAVTSTLLRETLQAYPELLSDAADALGCALAGIQPGEEARHNVLQVVTLLEACRRLGVDNALLEHARAVGSAATQLRVRTQASAQAEKRRARRPRPSGALQPVPWAQGEPFPSLRECRAWLEHRFPQETVTMVVKPVETRDGKDAPFEQSVPRYVYRGESGAFPTTLSSLDRVVADTRISVASIEDIVRTTIALRRDLHAAHGLPPLLAEGFLQHYGMPTRDFDVTASIDVACSFGGDLAVGEIGALCAMSTDRLDQNMRLVDLRDHPTAERPKRQQAFVITDPEREHRDLKNPDTITTCGIHWARFVMTELDLEAFRPDPWLLDAHSDRAAGLIQTLIDSYEQIDDDAAEWIAGRLQPAPFVFITLSKPDDAEGVPLDWVSADEAGIPYDEIDSRARNREYWSRRFPRPVQRQLPPELLSSPQEIAPSPGTVLQVMSRRGLEEIGLLKPPERT